MTNNTNNSQDTDRRTQLLQALPWLWLALAAFWAVVIFATDQQGGPLALWIAITVVPITVLQSRLRSADAAM